MRPLLALLLSTIPAFAADNIAKSEALTPAEELKSFKLPAGFQVQLVAAEPDIGKPIQIAFDSAGRLWVTTSREYPFAAEKGKGKDKLFILSDFDDTGKAKKIETFFDGLNIPIGILPLPDGKSCLVSEVGRILKLTDTTGTGKADKVEELFTGFGTEDTHGMTNSFLYMPDGWVYATHGFKNTSKVKAKDGSEITMNSGNTYRFKPDGSSIQIVTRGQVNPFGLCCDPYLNLYTADCHSKPITQLIRGATYQSFTKPHDGLGFAPHVTNHSHGSTALCGLVWYSATHFPKEYRDCMFLGNVVTNRINADRITFKGSTPVAEELPDFLTSSDPWFRPTDIKLGMDGALYFADFYNRIIGHYEVDLKHPQRDKDRGRVWRIVYKGKAETGVKTGEPGASATGVTDLKKAKLTELYDALRVSNTTTKLQAFHELVRRFTEDPNLDAQMSYFDVSKNPVDVETLVSTGGLLAHIGERTGKKEFSVGYEKMVGNLKFTLPKQQLNRYDAIWVRALASKESWTDDVRKVAATALEELSDSPRSQRAAIDGIVLHPHADFVQPLLKFIPTIPAEDTHLKFAARVALRNCLRDEANWKTLKAVQLIGSPQLLDMAIALPNPTTAGLLSEIIWNKDFPNQLRIAAAAVVGRVGAQEKWDGVTAASGVGLKEYQVAVQSLFNAIVASGRTKKLTDGGGLPTFLVSFKKLLFESLNTKDDDALFRESIRSAKLYLQLVSTDAFWQTEEIASMAVQGLSNSAYSTETITEAIEVLAFQPSTSTLEKIRKSVKNENLPIFTRARLAMIPLKSSTTVDAVAAKDLIKLVPYTLAIQLAVGLAGDPFGADLLLAAVKAGEAPARLLQEKAVLDRLKTSKVNNLDARVKELTAGLPSAEKRLDDIIKKRALAYSKAKADAKLGKAVFAKNCAACHTLENVGAKVGPQLDGIGVRGLERLLEDTLDPNRNVDAAFRATKFDMLDGKTITGLLLREEGAVYVVSDPTGKELRLAKADVDKKSISQQSAMPANVDTLVPEADYFHLMAYLLEQKPK